jgi:hypothetical protein
MIANSYPQMKSKPFSQTLEIPGRDSLFINTLRPSPVVARNPQTFHLVAITVSQSYPQYFFPCSSSPLYHILIICTTTVEIFLTIKYICYHTPLPLPPSHLQTSSRPGAPETFRSITQLRKEHRKNSIPLFTKQLKPLGRDVRVQRV